jgi:hypothetical protein
MCRRSSFRTSACGPSFDRVVHASFFALLWGPAVQCNPTFSCETAAGTLTDDDPCAADPASCTATRLASAGTYNCVIAATGALRCWGFAPRTAEFDPSHDLSIQEIATPSSVPGVDRVEAIYLGPFRACAIIGADLSCWGTTRDPFTPSMEEPEFVGPDRVHDAAVRAVSIEVLETCVAGEGDVSCWGGRYGDGARIANTAGAIALGAGTDLRCALVPPSELRCWSPSAPFVADDVHVIEGAVELVVAPRHGCVRSDAGTVECFGSNLWGELGRVTSSDRDNEPAPVEGLDQAISICAGGHPEGATAHSCAALEDGRVRCWGANTYGQLGTGSFADSATAVEVIALTDVVEVACGLEHTCARLASGAVRCWGAGHGGQLGLDAIESDGFPFPIEVHGLL